ncbi:nucleoside recognition membrane protein YjiH [Cytobacillus horneckiae]|uniref:Histidine transporter n=1 Tax=Cytobacillus horneckiae TaxID=549687 RepID=A0A2N0ZI02_9BACI|nr:YjiH family protein [Cytobacillus horneckiae]MBN6886876.1 YjiH family protein [Cytobacillus horneckiae]MCM3177655.1 YjiH family protein [Cytobacillus horneckiae]MEC1157962.1 YjiH family protein [Cytobacillus horneckiae]MED2937113.1 YjiH family protein [Cytobacillus horneckiae]PKG29142.1 histidine transporter [Cytobacillus horneckiae]
MEREIRSGEKIIKPNVSRNHVLKFFLYSALGIFMFFIPVTINGQSSIMLDHIVTGIQIYISGIVPYYALLVIFLGSVYPFFTKTWKRNKVTIVFSFLKVLGLITAVMIVFKIGPSWLFNPNMGPFLFDKLVTPVGLLVPIGSVFLALLVGYGLLEFAGVLMKPIMRPVFKTPGRSAIDAVASFVGSYSVGLLITNRLFKEGKYSIKEAAIIATGFSTVSVTFMVVVAKTLGLMDLWNTYFWITLIVTFTVTAITVRIWPLRTMSDDYYMGQPGEREEVSGNLLKAAWKEGKKAAGEAPSLLENIRMNFKDGFIMTMSILPSIMSVGLLGLVLVEFTPIFDWLGYLFYPVTALIQLPDPMLAAKASAVGIAEMFLPSLIVAEAALVTRFVIGVVSIAAIIFFSALVPCILSTDIPLTVPQIIFIWIERTVLALLIVTPIAFLIL